MSPRAKRELPHATNLGTLLRRYRTVEEKNMRDLGREIGVGASTWMRMEHGYMPDAETLVKLLVWLFKEPSQ